MIWTVFLQSDFAIEEIGTVEADDAMAAIDAASRQHGNVHAPRCIGVVPQGKKLPLPERRLARLDPHRVGIAGLLEAREKWRRVTFKQAGIEL